MVVVSRDSVDGLNATEEDLANAKVAYAKWRDQFPLAAARREYYGLDCTPLAVQNRFLSLSQLLGLPSNETLEIFSRDWWVLSESSDSIPVKLKALRSCGTDQEVLDFLRWAPRSIATTSAAEIQERGLTNMLARSLIGEVWELLASPLRILIKFQLTRSAEEVERQRSEESNLSLDSSRGQRGFAEGRASPQFRPLANQCLRFFRHTDRYHVLGELYGCDLWWSSAW